MRMGANNDRRGAKCIGVRANEVVWLIRGADIFNVREHPCLHTELHGARNDGTYDQA
jgi:hypothetical protein